MFKGKDTGKETALLVENAALKRENELLAERILELKDELKETRNSLKYTQEALVAKEAPEAYRDRRYHEELAAAEAEAKAEAPEGIKQKIQKVNTLSRLAEEMEKPLFDSADDMISQLGRALGIPGMDNNSLHGNDES